MSAAIPEQHPADTEWHRWAPIGQTLDASGIVGGPVPSIRSIEMLPLDQMLVPERPRGGEVDPAECGACRPSEFTIWADADWKVSAGFGGPTALPFVGIVAHALAEGGGAAFPEE